MSFNKYRLYELSVQSPDTHIDWFVSIYKDIRGSYASLLREDFCGTFQLSCSWVKRNKNNRAVSVDLDPEPLRYGKKHHWSKLKRDQKERLTVVQGDVLEVRTQKHDVIIGCNFSFFIFKKRKELLHYLKSCYQSLNSKGILILEMAGGPGMIYPAREQKTLYDKESKQKFTYIWHQKSFDPIHRNARYGIHFKFPDGTSHKNVFTYDWRLWTIPEVRDLFEEAGFKKSYVYWEASHKGEGTGEFVRTEKGDNAYAWIAYVVAAR